MAARCHRRPTRTARGPSWRCRCAPLNSSPTPGGQERCRPMKTTRRTVLQLLAAAPAAAGFTWTEAQAQTAHTQAQTAQTTAQKTGTPYKPKFFNTREWATIGILADMIIPKDDRSGSATDAGVPQFMDFMMVDQPGRQTAMRGGLAWLDRECVNRYEKTFVACTVAERSKVLDDIA